MSLNLDMICTIAIFPVSDGDRFRYVTADGMQVQIGLEEIDEEYRGFLPEIMKELGGIA
jgi:hypothetical protein